MENANNPYRAPASHVQDAHRPERRALWRRVAAGYLIIVGVIQVLSQIVIFSNDIALALEALPLWFLVIGVAIAAYRIVAGALLLRGTSHAVAACGVVAAGSITLQLVSPTFTGTLGTVTWSVFNMATLIEWLLTVWIWWSAYQWRARGDLRNGGRARTDKDYRSVPRSPAVTIVAILISVHFIASLFHMPLIREAARTGEINPITALVFVTASVLLAIGGLLLWLAIRSARHVLLAALLPWVAQLSFRHILVQAGLVLAACAFLVAIRGARDQARAPEQKPEHAGIQDN